MNVDFKVSFKINDEIITLEIPVDGSDHLFKITNDDQYTVDYLMQLINNGFIHLKEPPKIIYKLDDHGQIEKTIYDKGLPLKAVENITEGESGEATLNILEANGEKKIWGYDETIHIINTIGSYYSDIISPSPKLRKKAWENILNTLLSFKIETTIQEIKKKWSNLIQTYNKTKDLKTRTGRGPTRFQFFDQIDAIIGMKPTNACNFSMNIGSATENSSESGIDTAEASSSTQTENTTNSHGNVEKLTLDENTKKETKKRTNYTMEYLKIKKEYLQRKDWERETKSMEKEEEKRRKDEERKEKSEREEKRLQLEERKVKALEAYVALQQKKLETA